MRHRQKSANESRKSQDYCRNGKACALMISTFSIELSLVIDAKAIVNIVDALFGCCSYSYTQRSGVLHRSQHVRQSCMHTWSEIAPTMLVISLILHIRQSSPKPYRKKSKVQNGESRTEKNSKLKGRLGQNRENKTPELRRLPVDHPSSGRIRAKCFSQIHPTVFEESSWLRASHNSPFMPMTSKISPGT